MCFFAPIFWGPDKRPVQQPDKDNGDNVFFLTGRKGEDKQQGAQKQQNQNR